MRKTQSLISASCLWLLAFAFSAPLAASQNWAEDIHFYRASVFEADKSYSVAERETAESMLVKLEEDFPGMSDAQIELRLAEILAITNNGHSFLMPGGWTHRYAGLPIKFHVFADGIFVITATTDFQHLVGHRLLSIDGYSTEALAEKWASYQGGRPGWRNQYFPYFLETPEILYAAGLSDDAADLDMVFEKPDGETVSVAIAGLHDLPPLEGMDLYMAPSRLLRYANQTDAEHQPLYLQSPGQSFRFEMLDNPKTAYIQFKANVDFTGSQDIDAFIDTVFGQLRSSQPNFIILDQRFNFGGDLNITRKLMQALSGFLGVDGKLFLVTSGRTFSAGISSVGYAMQASDGKAIIVGEATGDELEFWAEGDLQVLPNSGLTFLMATERHNYQTGCPEDDCHGSIQRHPIEVDSLQPQIPAALNYSDYKKGADPALDAIEAYIHQHQEPAG